MSKRKGNFGNSGNSMWTAGEGKRARPSLPFNITPGDIR